MSKQKIRAWHLANTTIRNPYRLKGGLEALVAGGYEGKMNKEKEEEIALALDAAGIITLKEDTKDITSIARKWRSVFVKLGFLWPDVNMTPKIRETIQEEIGEPFTLTPNGRRLLSSKSLQGEQEVILRAVAAILLPNPIEPRYHFEHFSPLKLVIRLIDAIERKGGNGYISRLEMASIVILSNGNDEIYSLADKIIEQRNRRAKAQRKRKFDNEEISEIAENSNLNPSTLSDYQDVTFRYLKATGLFQSRGRGISLVDEQRRTAFLIAKQLDVPLSSTEFLHQLASGATLPTDNQEGATQVLQDLLILAKEWNVDFDHSRFDLTSPKGISLARHELTHLIFEEKELKYAAEQANQLDEILAYLQILEENRKSISFDGESLSIPMDERPAYFEWLLWRLLLALNELVIPPSKVRRFHIDQDFLPVSTASGGGADVIGEYSDSVLVVEVTLTENSRQEAAEGEPVRRHVAQVLEEFGPLNKSVYGLFVARKIDTNAAETFRIGVWYLKDDIRVNLDIVPLTIKQLRTVIIQGIKANKITPALLIDLIIEISIGRLETEGAPEWKQQISELLEA